MEPLDILNVVFGLISLIGVFISIIFYYKQKLTQKDLQTEKEKINELRKIFHWQLQAIHHKCNRIENIILDPDRPDRCVIEVARGIRDSADSLMGQLLGKVTVFPWANVPIVDPNTEEEIGQLFGTKPIYKEDYEAKHPEVFTGTYIESNHLPHQ